MGLQIWNAVLAKCDTKCQALFGNNFLTPDLKLAPFPGSLAATRCGFTFYLADPISSVRGWLCRVEAFQQSNSELPSASQLLLLLLACRAGVQGVRFLTFMPVLLSSSKASTQPGSAPPTTKSKEHASASRVPDY